MTLRSVAALVGCLVVATAVAALLAALGTPLAWVIGALLGAAIYVNRVGPVADSGMARRVGQLVLGAATAAILTPAILRDMVELAPVMIGSALVANLAAVLMARPFAAVAGTDRLTAILSVLPAGLAEMANLAIERGARSEVVALTHTVRVAFIVLTVPLILGAARNLPAPVAREAPFWTLPACFGLSLGAALIARRLGMLNPWIVMPMIVGAGFVLAGAPIAPMPRELVIASQVLIGSALGARLELESFAQLPRVFAASLLSTAALTLVMMAGLAPLLSLGLDLDPVTLVLAVAPGGLGEMVAASKALGAMVPLVVGFQFIRSLLTNLAAPFLVRLASRSSRI